MSLESAAKLPTEPATPLALTPEAVAPMTSRRGGPRARPGGFAAGVGLVSVVIPCHDPKPNGIPVRKPVHAPIRAGAPGLRRHTDRGAAPAPPAPAATPGAAARVPLCVPEIRGNEWDYVKQCLDTNWVSSVGSFVNRFEEMVSARAGGGHAVATNSGTAALHLALLVAGVKPDEEVVVPTVTFIAPANAVRYVGAHPVFIDAEPRYAQMDVDKALDFLVNGCQRRPGGLFNRATGRRVAALLPVHVLGHPVDMSPLLQAAARYDLPVIEDATESLGAAYRGRPVGSMSRAACFSFNGNKLVTTGGGGMLVSPDAAFARQAKYLTTQAKDDEEEFVHGRVGYNYRLSNVAAAIGCAQFEQFDAYVAAKRRIAAAYADGLGGVPGIEPMRQAPWARAVFWMYTVRVDAARYGADSRTLLRRLGAAGIQTRPLWQPMHRSPAHRGAQAWRCEVADELYRDCLSLPCSVGLTPDQQQRVIDVIRSGRP